LKHTQKKKIEIQENVKNGRRKEKKKEAVGRGEEIQQQPMKRSGERWGGKGNIERRKMEIYRNVE
jgi:hypothetical protein